MFSPRQRIATDIPEISFIFRKHLFHWWILKITETFHLAYVDVIEKIHNDLFLLNESRHSREEMGKGQGNKK